MVSGLLGGPIGVVVNLAVMVAEKITGIDLDQTGQMLLTGHAHANPPASDPAPAPAPVAQATPPAPPVSLPDQAWSVTQLAAYGVHTDSDGTLSLADLRGADVLNACELLRIQGARAAYGRAANLAG